MAKEEYYHQNIIEIILSRYEDPYDPQNLQYPKQPLEIFSSNKAKTLSNIYVYLYKRIQEFEDAVNLSIKEFEEKNPGTQLTKEFLVFPEGTDDDIVKILFYSFIINTPFIINTTTDDYAEVFGSYIEKCIKYLNGEDDLPKFPPRLLEEIADIHFGNLFFFGTNEGYILYNDNWSVRRDRCIYVLKSLIPPAPAPASLSQPETPGEPGVGGKRPALSQEKTKERGSQRPKIEGGGAAVELSWSQTPFGRKLDKTKGWWVELKKDKKCEMGVKFVRVKSFKNYKYGVHVDPEYFEKMTGASFWDLPLYRCGK